MLYRCCCADKGDGNAADGRRCLDGDVPVERRLKDLQAAFERE